jgi:energy-coupling factor transporter ATP-binding protein EcfA2
MPVRIKEIHVQNLGPIQKFSVQLQSFNLIYGHNEHGKTYLVEFIVRSLFKNISQWGLRPLIGTGKIHIEGLAENLVDFSPANPVKLEDFLEKTSPGLPPDFSRLLVVKGAEMELKKGDKGVEKAILKRYLSNQEVLDIIDDRISKTIQKTKVENLNIVGNKTGEIKTREDLQKKIKLLNGLFSQIDIGYSGGKRKVLSEEKEKLEKELELVENAKRYLASHLSEEIKQLVKTENLTNDKIIQSVRDNLSVYKQKTNEYKRKKQTQKTAEHESRHYDWLKYARDYYQNRLTDKSSVKQPVFLVIFTGIALLAVLLSAVFRITYGVFGSVILLVFLGYQYIKNIQKAAQRKADDEELRNLQIEFRDRFDRKLTGLPLIQELLHNIEDEFNTNRLLKKQLSEELKEIDELRLMISDRIYELTGERMTPEMWDGAILDLEIKMRALKTQIENLKIRLAELNVDSSDYVTSKSEIEYSKENHKQLTLKLAQIQSKLNEENRKLSTLKQYICNQTGDDIDINWESLIENLRNKRETLLQEYKQITSEIIAKILLHRVIDNLRSDEDSKIAEGLKSGIILNPLIKITGRYHGFHLNGDKLIISDRYHDFHLSDLSTGAQEQVLLALRIGFSAKILGRDHLFLILDDAFQYSDWQRRERLMDVMVNLAKNGWQILYFTMDDHIKNLFDEKGKIFGSSYKKIELK